MFLTILHNNIMVNMDMEVKFKLDINPDKLGDTILIAGLPGMGYTGKQAVDHLIKVLNAEKISDFKSPYLNSPVITTVNGIVEDLKEELFTFYHAETSKYDILLFTGAVQPPSAEWQHYVSYAAIEAVKEFRIKWLFTLAATPIEYYKYDVRVYGVATSKDLLDYLIVNGVIPMPGEGVISGMNGLLLGYAKKSNIEAASLLAETYLISGRDFIAPYVILKTLSRIIKYEFDLKELEDRAKAFHMEYTSKVKKKEEKKGLGYIS
ncbi:hypothetical protein DRN84_00205 [Candidatus Geothermarchaeota archaeon]|nr:MAG: hypothetical protein DRN84_00205 [Candidatus Geothermarchaeota archaeon]HEW93834.1 hypothetical protein [Thermoprotei archaeon]